MQKAVDGSIKDIVRRAESLNAMKQRLIDRQDFKKAEAVARFQNPVDRPYKELFGAAALFSSEVFDKNEIEKTKANHHPGVQNLSLLVIHGSSMMTLVHDLYQRAANEA